MVQRQRHAGGAVADERPALAPFEQDASRAVGEDVPFRLRVGKVRDEDARRGFKRRAVERCCEYRCGVVFNAETQRRRAV